jgi:uncharacterized protein
MNYFRIAFAAALLLLGTTVNGYAQAQGQLWDAAITGDTAAIRKAITDGAKIDALDLRTSQNGRYALNWAALGNKTDALKLLIALKAPLEAENITGYTALHHAAEVGAVESARLLLEAGADPKHQNRVGETPADVALARGFNQLGALLMDAAAKARP